MGVIETGFIPEHGLQTDHESMIPYGEGDRTHIRMPKAAILESKKREPLLIENPINLDYIRAVGEAV